METHRTPFYWYRLLIYDTPTSQLTVKEVAFLPKLHRLLIEEGDIAKAEDIVELGVELGLDKTFFS